MPRNWDREKELKQRDIVFKTADQALEFLSANGRLKTRDGDLVLMTNAKGDLMLAANKVKSRGGKYYLNKKIIDAVGKDFVSGGGMMRASVSEDEARKVIDLLASGEAMGQPTFFLAENMPDKAREIVAIFSDNLLVADSYGRRELESPTFDAAARRLPFIKEALSAGATVDHISVRHHGSDWTVVSFENAEGTYLVKGEDVYVTQASVQEAQAAIEADPDALPGINDLKFAGDIEIRVSEIRSSENRIESQGRVVEHSMSM